ncbi:MAG: FAD-binding protein, partial [Gammaproteobacteria bacterium]|nr:FAD-binding protein [Gammaproteobacteria bacterium]
PGPVDNHYDPIARSIAEQPGAIAWVVYDRRIDDVPNWQRSIRSDQPPIEAATLESLAAKLGIPGAALARTVAAYNRACGDGEFKPLEPDGLATHALVPAKSNWARPIDAPPYCAYPIISANCFTYGGLKINPRAQVLDNDGRPITGLYAAGETVGLYYQVYAGATSVLRGAVFGRIAGATAGAMRAQHPSAP